MSELLTEEESYGDGSKLPEIHPDPTMNKDILIGELCARLGTARDVLKLVLEPGTVSDTYQIYMDNVHWALEETHPKTLLERHNNIG